MGESYIDLIPLGGLGEIGLNMMVLESASDLVVVDCGLMFPEEEMYGVDIVIPDFSYVLERLEKFRGVILTHGHDDHIGALPFLLRQVNVPVFGTRLTLALVKEKLKEHRYQHEVRLQTVSPREKLALGPFNFDFIRVSHSILDGVGLGIETPVGTIIHTGDFKLEQSPGLGDRLDLNRFAEYGERGVLLLLSDSTNVERAGYTISEQTVSRTFREIFRECRGRIIVSCFASSLVRIQQVVDVAAAFDRKVAFDGKSMVNNVGLARELGYLKIPDSMIIPVGEIKKMADDRVVLVTTGSQGEPMSALTRMAFGDHKQIKIKPGDTVILSSRFIPGNERAITKIINNLYRQGAEVIYETVSEVHVSGHAYQEELKLMINLVRPEYFIPIHGEYRHLIKHVQLAHSLGLAPESCLLTENGDCVRLTDGFVQKLDKAHTGRVLVDGKGVGDVGQVVLRDRKHLAEHGMVIPLVVIDDQTAEILSGPYVISKGFIFEEDQQHLLEDSKCLILEVFDRVAEARMQNPGLTPDIGEITAEIQKELKRFFYHQLERRPVIIPQIITL